MIGELDTRARMARLAASPAGCALVFGWAVAEATSWPVITELLIAALMLSGPSRPLHTGVRLAACGAVGSAVGGTIMLLLARNGILLPQPLTTPAMVEYARDNIVNSGVRGLFSQPMSGVPYKVYARLAGQHDLPPAVWFGASAAVRFVRMVAVAMLAVAAARVTRRWERLYTWAMGAGVLTFVVGMCLVVSSWSGSVRNG
ncbi:MAG TPA: hypothetical protein VJ831_04575 [Jatrophihabitantaceae bacterium]|nr:hypothetical protein [Jatrophihabitantaceae bacterium]